MIKNEICKQEDFFKPYFKEVASELNESVVLHRKLWEYVTIVQAIKERNLLKPGKSGIGFGVGSEPLSAIFAKHGCSIMATDMPLDNDKISLWSTENQHSKDLSRLNNSQICPKEIFEKNVKFRSVDMNYIPDDIGKFDFTWSSCALEHLGSIEKGLNFLINQFELLKPGGYAIHTTELNMSSNQSSLREGTTVLFRKRDLNVLLKRLKKMGAEIADIDFNSGAHVYDNFVDVPPYKHNPHLKLKLAEYVTTSAIIIFQKPLNYKSRIFHKQKKILFKDHELDSTFRKFDDKVDFEKDFYYKLKTAVPAIDGNSVNNSSTFKSNYPVYMGDNLALTRLFTGQKFFVDTRDLSLAPHILLDGFWEQEITNHFLNLLTEEDVFINIGANFGYYMILAALKIKTGQIIGFEPVPRLADIIKRNISINGIGHMTKIENIGVSAKKEKRHFYFYNNVWGSSTFLDQDPNETEPHQDLNLECTSMDEYCKEKNISHAEMILIDVEGLEEQLFIGMTQIIKNSPRLKIFLEFSHGVYQDAEKFFNHLAKEFKYIYYLLDRKTPLLINTYSDLASFLHINQLDLILSQEELF